ncbi:hypothetical protein [Clostridium tagluense]|uniref:Uncharacterized protein n=1 Tax=Clostridium tagluense TaxID=360422 RepID=A0A401USG2_9CLOT|nr:hypothetical protein [Clostridium tagluense]GCD12441.1 hypothetical protein Ctaglu_40640 [Clostridium tagluense]
MKKTSLRIKILSGMLCTGLVFSRGSLSFATVKDSGSVNVRLASSMDVKVPMDKEKLKLKQERQAEMMATLETVIKESVTGSIITQTEGDKVLEYVNAKSQKKSVENKTDKKCKSGKCEGERGGLFKDLVADGILTKEKSDALRERMHLKNTELRNQEDQE